MQSIALQSIKLKSRLKKVDKVTATLQHLTLSTYYFINYEKLTFSTLYFINCKELTAKRSTAKELAVLDGAVGVAVLVEALLVLVHGAEAHTHA